MAGHSKWANIKHKKAKEDAKRGKVFSKLVKKITSAARRGGGDLDANTELRLYVQKAKAANMPSDNIERAVLKGTGDLEGVSYEDFTYEGYGPGGVAIYLSGATDNKNRTVAEVRHAFSKNGGNLGADGCVAWMFEDRGILSIEEDRVDDADAFMLLAIEHGALDVEIDGGIITATSAAEDFVSMRDAIEQQGYSEFVTDEITKLAENTVTPDLSAARTNMRLLDFLEDYDDIEHVYHNLDLSDEVAEVLAAE